MRSTIHIEPTPIEVAEVCAQFLWERSRPKLPQRVLDSFVGYVLSLESSGAPA